jgi:hypothetical protein
MTPEGRIRNLIMSWLRTQKALAFIHDSVGIYDPKIKQFRRNLSPYRLKGVSDILGIWKGKFLAIEVKSPGKKPTPEQKEFLGLVSDFGGIGILAYSLDDVIHTLVHGKTLPFGRWVTQGGAVKSVPAELELTLSHETLKRLKTQSTPPDLQNLTTEQGNNRKDANEEEPS